jgi:hypothetical protein
MIEKYDNFFTPAIQTELHNSIMNSNFRIGWEDSIEVQHRMHPNLHSPYSFKDVQSLRILDVVLDKLKEKNITINDYNKCVINLTKNMDVNFIHNHPDQVVFLHYSNLTWNPEWGGETVFYEHNGKDILESNPYTPNRAIIFDGQIKHTLKSQNNLGPTYRFTTSLFFNKPKY